jgi:O-antigen ligase
VPSIWVAILASRPVGLWLDASQSAWANVDEGSPLDRAVLVVLIGLAVVILVRRRLDWQGWAIENLWVLMFFVYCGMSLLWSDFPDVALKRWIRAAGSVLIIIVILSEKDPVEAVRAVIRRCVYVLVPASLLLIKYSRGTAVAYNWWTGEEYLVGVTTDKNALGRLCLVATVFLVCDIGAAGIGGVSAKRRLLDRALGVIMLCLTVWLLLKSKSATSMVAAVGGVALWGAFGVAPIRTRVRRIGSFILVAVVLLCALEATVGLMELVVISVGRNMTLTDRTDIWRDLWNFGTNPILGVGYDSFWLGERLEDFLSKHQVSAAHNGYLEAYLEIGGVGVVLLMGMLMSTFRKVKRALVFRFFYGRLRMIMLCLFVVYNLTESSYKITTLIGFLFVLAGMDPPERVSSGSHGRARVGSGRSLRGAGERSVIARRREEWTGRGSLARLVSSDRVTLGPQATRAEPASREEQQAIRRERIFA